MRSLEILLTELIDYAGLFPPAELEMPQAVARFADYRHGADAWMLGRFITPIARLDEFERAARSHLDDDSDAAPWKLSVLAGSDLVADLSSINEFNRRHTIGADAGRVLIDTIETRASTVDEIQRMTNEMHPTLTVYVEIPFSADPSELMGEIARAGWRAKVRSGGTSAEAFPSTVELARFMRRCFEAKTAFKATAGLHHPIRSVQRLTYEPDSPFGVTHGFLNVFLAAAWIENGVDNDAVIELLEETKGANFAFDDTGVSWQGLRLTNEQLARTRKNLAMAFGSCSFAEPLEDLRSLGLR